MARSVGETFATADSDGLRYISALKDDWTEAALFLQYAESCIASSVKAPPLHANPGQVLARIVDVDDEGRILDASASISEGEVQDGHPGRASAVDNFVDAMRSCKTVGTACRILLLDAYRCGPRGESQWPAQALCLHLLGIELDLSITQIQSVVEWPIDPFIYCDGANVLPGQNPKSSKFGIRRTLYGPASFTAAGYAIGPRQLSGQSLDIGLSQRRPCFSDHTY